MTSPMSSADSNISMSPDSESRPESAHCIYVTAKDIAEARKIGRILVEERLVACVNIFDGMRSIYRWEGAVVEAGEAVLIAKTRAILTPDVIARIRSLHSYTCPCIVAVPVVDGAAAYLQWIVDTATGEFVATV
jgi:periplasmic divalent cation tolerance protein